MSVDLGALLDQAAPLITSAIDTGGTLITITRDPDDTAVTVDPDTLELTAAGSAIATDVPALVLPDSATTEPIGPARPAQLGRYRVYLSPDIDVPTDPAARLVVTVTTSRDPAQIDLRLYVDQVETSAAGLIRVLRATTEAPA